MVYNDVIMLNKNVNKHRCQRENISKWITFEYERNTIKNVLLWKFPMFSGFYETHLPAGYLKSEFVEAWDNNYDVLDSVSRNKIRTNGDVSENFIRYCQLAKGRFEPINKLKYGRYCSMKSKALPSYITSGKYKYICINDEDFGEPFRNVKAAFDLILPDISTFEKYI